MPHASDVLPLLGALSKTVSDEDAVVVEYAGDVMDAVPQPSMVRA